MIPEVAHWNSNSFKLDICSNMISEATSSGALVHRPLGLQNPSWPSEETIFLTEIPSNNRRFSTFGTQCSS
jgi:hypothetical protein